MTILPSYITGDRAARLIQAAARWVCDRMFYDAERYFSFLEKFDSDRLDRLVVCPRFERDWQVAYEECRKAR